MGYDYQPIVDGKEEMEEYRHSIEYIQKKKTMLQELDALAPNMSRNISKASMKMMKNESQKTTFTAGRHSQKSGNENGEFNPDADLIDRRFAQFDQTVKNELEKVDEELEEVCEEIKDPKKGKKK